jgi:hypothetical protein
VLAWVNGVFAAIAAVAAIIRPGTLTIMRMSDAAELVAIDVFNTARAASEPVTMALDEPAGRRAARRADRFREAGVQIDYDGTR